MNYRYESSGLANQDYNYHFLDILSVPSSQTPSLLSVATRHRSNHVQIAHLPLSQLPSSDLLPGVFYNWKSIVKRNKAQRLMVKRTYTGMKTRFLTVRRSHTLILWKGDQSPDSALAPGEYNWPFAFTIPPSVPPSFEGVCGNIRYSLEGRVGTGLLKLTTKLKSEFLYNN